MTKAEPGWGYRFLEVGERTQEGDETRDYSGQWLPTVAGYFVQKGHEHSFRRNILAHERVRAPDCQAALFSARLKVAEILPDGREVRSVTATPYQHDVGLWRIMYQFGTPGTYEMDSSMRAVRR